MKKCRSFLTIPIALLGIVLSLCVFALPAYAADGDVDDNPPGLFEMGFNEDMLEDNDLTIPKGPNRGKLDPRANILGCLAADANPLDDDACGVWSAQNPDTNRTSSSPPMGLGPDWGDLFTGVMNVNEPGADPLYYFVVPEFTDLIGLPVEDFIDYGALAAVFVGDHISASSAVDDTTMVSDGSDANNDAIVTYAWGTDSVPSKDDITNAYCYATTKPDIGSPDEDLLIYCGVERLSNDGSSHVDIELNKNYVGLDEEPPCDKDVCYFVGERAEGDLLVSLDFSNGGDFGSMSVRKWNNSAKVWSDPVVDLEKEGCNDEIVNGLTIPAGAACAFNNNADINGGNWPNFIKDVTPIDTDAGFTDGELPRNAFSEFGLNVTDILGQTQCISYVQIKTRTSHSFTSQLKDFAVRPFPICGSKVRTEIHAGQEPVDIQKGVGTGTLKVGTAIHDFAEVTVTGPINLEPTGVVDFYLYENDNCAGDPAQDSMGHALIAGAPDNKATARSKDFLLSPGTYSFHADFIPSPGSDIPSSSLPLDDCEVITIEPYDPVISTQIHVKGGHGPDIQGTTIYVGPTIHDHATVVAPGFPGAPVPTGIVDFKLFSTDNCTGSFTALTGSLDGSGAAVTTDFTPLGDTKLSYSASYSADTDPNYNATTESECEPLNIVKWKANLRTEIHMGAGEGSDVQSKRWPVTSTFHDHAYWSQALTNPSGAPTPTGDVTFELYLNTNCVGDSFTGDLGLITWPQTAALDGSFEAKTAIFAPPVGEYGIKTIWNKGGLDDPNYDEVSEVCEWVEIFKLDPIIATKVVVRDLAYVSPKLSTDPQPTGSVTFRTYTTPDCSGAPVSTSDPITLVSGEAGQPAGLAQLLETNPDVVSYIADYSGDGNYNRKVHNCELVQFSVLP